MGKGFLSGHGPDEIMLMPADPREWLPPGHLAWKVIELAGEMDLSGFSAGYRADRQGGQPYGPRMMVTLILYCYCRGRRSARDIEGATWDDVGARIIAGGLHPDHATVARFTGRHQAAVLELLPASVKACAAEGLVDLGVVAGDGTKLKASAAMSATVTAQELDAQIAELEAWISADLAGWVQDMLAAEGTAPASSSSDDGSSSSDDGGKGRKKWKEKPDRAVQMLQRRLEARARLAGNAADSAAPRIAELAGLVAKREDTLRRHEEKARDTISARAAREAAGEKIPGRRPAAGGDRSVRKARASLDRTRAALEDTIRQAALDARINTTDPSSRIMPLKKGGYDQLFNVQALATARTQVILAVTRHPSPADTCALQALLAAARHVLAAAGIPGRILRALFDAGYASDANFTLDIPEELWIALTRTGTTQIRSTLPSWQDMNARLSTPEGRELYKQRAATIEPVFAQLTQRLGRTLSFRGHLADAELALWAASHNILKAITARTRRHSLTPAAA